MTGIVATSTTNMMDLTTNETDITDAENEFAKQQIMEDYYVVNDSIIPIDAATF